MIPRVVFDTNIYVSALCFGGKPRQAIEYSLAGKVQSLVSIPLKLELERILQDKFSFSSHELDAQTAPLWHNSIWVAPASRLFLCTDEADNRVLECALEGHADFIVTGDHHLLDLSSIENCTILKPHEFLAVLQSPV